MSVEPIFRSAEERAVTVRCVEGEVPHALRGTLLRNGGGVLRVGDDELGFFDAAGVVCGLGLRDGAATLRVRLVRTPMVEQERAAGRLVFRRAFLNLPGRWANVLNIKLAPGASHDVYGWGGKVYAAGFPAEEHWALDAGTLDTVGPHRFAPKGNPQSPMPRTDPATGHLVAYHVTPGLLRTDTITFVEFDADWNVRREVSAPLGRRFAQLHDLAFSETYFVVIENPQRLDVLAAIGGKSTLFDAVRWESGMARVVLVPRAGGPAVSVELPEGNKHAFHVINAYDDGDRVIVDACMTSAPTDFSSTLPPALRARSGIELRPYPMTQPVRLTIDVAAGTATSRVLAPVLVESPEVNPAFHGRRYGVAWLGTGLDDQPPEADPEMSGWTRGVVRLDLETGRTTRWSRAGCIVSQPSFAARPGGTAEDDGWILAWVLDLGTAAASVVILDARDLTHVATLDLGGHLPGTSHCRFEPGIELAAP